jgi:hypothetical protein
MMMHEIYSKETAPLLNGVMVGRTDLLQSKLLEHVQGYSRAIKSGKGIYQKLE